MDVEIRYEAKEVTLTERLRRVWGLDEDVDDWYFLCRVMIYNGEEVDSTIIACFRSKNEAELFQTYLNDFYEFEEEEEIED